MNQVSCCCQRSTTSSTQTAADTQGAAFTLKSWRKRSAQLARLLHIHDNTMEWTDTAASISPSDTTTTHSNSRNKDMSGTPPTAVRGFVFSRLCCKCCFSALASFESCWWKLKLLCFLVCCPLAPHAALLEFCSAFLRTSLWINHLPHTVLHMNTGYFTSPYHTHTHTQKVILSKSLLAILNISYHQSFGCCMRQWRIPVTLNYMTLCSTFACQIFSKLEVQNN